MKQKPIRPVQLWAAINLRAGVIDHSTLAHLKGTAKSSYLYGYSETSKEELLKKYGETWVVKKVWVSLSKTNKLKKA